VVEWYVEKVYAYEILGEKNILNENSQYLKSMGLHSFLIFFLIKRRVYVKPITWEVG
jgi:hypothetical protein